MKIVPNILSTFRICLVPVFVLAYFLDPNDIKVYAIIVFAIAAISDLLDGYIARKFDAQSNLGKILDPLGDKLMTFAVMICITFTIPLLFWAVLVFFIKELLLGIGGLVIHRVAKVEIPSSNILGKLSTVLFFIVCVTLMVFQNIPDYIAVVLMFIAIGFTLISFFSYLGAYIKIMKNRKETSQADKLSSTNGAE